MTDARKAPREEEPETQKVAARAGGISAPGYGSRENTIEDLIWKTMPNQALDFVGRSVSPAGAGGKVEELMITGPMPSWATKLGLKDRRGTLTWDSD